MKNGIFKILALIMVLTMAFSLFACNNESDKEGEVTIVISGEPETEYKIDLGKIQITKGLVSVLEYLKEEHGLNFKMSGTMIEEVGSIKSDYTAGEYVYIYTSVEADFDVSEYATDVEYKGKTLVSSGVGAADMTIKDGAVIYFGLVKWD